MRIIDRYGNEKDWAWVQSTYGPVSIDAISGDGYRVSMLAEVEGIMAFQCTLLNSAGGPVAGQQVAYIWPDGQKIEVTNGIGVAEHTAGAGEGYWPANGPGPITWRVQGPNAETIHGLGWLNGTNHRHLQVTLQWQEDVEPPPPPDESVLIEVLADLFAKLATAFNEAADDLDLASQLG